MGTPVTDFDDFTRVNVEIADFEDTHEGPGYGGYQVKEMEHYAYYTLRTLSLSGPWPRKYLLCRHIIKVEPRESSLCTMLPTLTRFLIDEM